MGKKYRIQNKALRITVRVVIIIIAAVTVIAAAGWITFRIMVRPPEIPQIPISGGQENPSANEGSEDEDGGLANEQTLPGFAQFEERKPNFYTFVIFGLTEGLNANTIMVAAYDAEAREGFIVSIPRDTLIDVQRTNRKIVSSYPSGRLGGRGHEGGVEQVRRDVQSLVGFRPDFYIRVDYAAFVRMVDAVGGVEIYVPFRMYYNDPWQNLHIDLQPGLQLLSGEDALRFSRYRTGTAGVSPTISDYQRIVHQQQVLSAVFQRLLTPASILRIPEFISIFNEYIYSDLTAGELLWFANQTRHIGGLDALSTYTIPMLGTSGAPFWYEFADPEGILELVNRTINPLVRDITIDDLRIAQ
ncbi:MAG: LCP family protein [Defluviitaleaceae bacterium]|nr:LCP family protein [Defluviitaleaceae bacterium]